MSTKNSRRRRKEEKRKKLQESQKQPERRTVSGCMAAVLSQAAKFTAGMTPLKTMTANDEMRAYLDYLVRHEQECTAENCDDCKTAQAIYDFTRNLIFSVVLHPEVAIPSGGRAAAAATGGEVKKSSRRAA